MNSALKIVLLSNSIFVFGGNLIVPIYALYVSSLGGGVGLAGALFGTKFLAMAVVSFAIMHFKDGHSLDLKILKLNYVVRSIVWIALVVNPSLIFLFVAEIVLGSAEGFGTPAFNSYISEHLDKNAHMKEWATFELMKNLLVAAASFIGGLVVLYLGFSWLFLLMGVSGFCAWIVLKKN